MLPYVDCVVRRKPYVPSYVLSIEKEREKQDNHHPLQYKLTLLGGTGVRGSGEKEGSVSWDKRNSCQF